VTAPAVPSEPTEPTVDVQVTGTAAPVISATQPVTTTASVTEKPVVTTQKPNRPSNTVWKEVPFPTHKIYTNVTMEPFDLRDTLTGYDRSYGIQFNKFFFRGIVLSLKQYEVSWTDDNGQQQGPFELGIIEVKITQEYSGKSPVSGDTIKILYPYSFAEKLDTAPVLAEKGEYVFITTVLDDVYNEYKQMISPNWRGEGEKYADVVSGAIQGLFPVENGNIYVRSGYFEHDNEAMRKALSSDSVENSKLLDYQYLQQGSFVAFNLDDFNREFKKLIDNAENLPTASSR
jgi:hypothetical protein